MFKKLTDLFQLRNSNHMSSINYINQELRITHSCGEIVKDKRRALLPGSSTVTRKAKVFIGEMAYKVKHLLSFVR